MLIELLINLGNMIAKITLINGIINLKINVVLFRIASLKRNVIRA